ncbi:SDR family oxidoreductase [Temperatibacter marinus]|uniref:SDR family oxidoreductase n=1 Tax=Temperatibacter marinus TaxID=1456591 RepID=A0AA52H9R4_9PROT|nr:SDR family oxidoreductase [Temperatibacter marinus]WND01955.1 SDR family oxidoreductase [Temperatibacter marinus]
MDLNLKGKKVIVTGGTRGIGAAIVDLFLSEGAEVAYCARSADQVTETVKAHQQKGCVVYGAAVDVSDKQAYLAWLRKAVDDLGGLDILVPNVSGGAQPGLEGWESAFSIDLMASVMACESMLEVLSKSSCGAITVITTISGLEQTGGPSAYGTLKAGLVSYCGQLSELAGAHGVRVNCVSPGPIMVKDGFWGQAEGQNPDMVAQVKARHHSGRLGTPEEVANAVVFLSSPQSSWITGTNLIIDGGFTKRIQF